mmetsp:Transcript_51377/g.149209  ORF Transcript_51377/g.149209 Transcript_51377/m.149209 type:complete len:236 (-) Transcript_51377:304-1011(-)
MAPPHALLRHPRVGALPPAPRAPSQQVRAVVVRPSGTAAGRLAAGRLAGGQGELVAGRGLALARGLLAAAPAVARGRPGRRHGAERLAQLPRRQGGPPAGLLLPPLAGSAALLLGTALGKRVLHQRQFLLEGMSQDFGLRTLCLEAPPQVVQLRPMVALHVLPPEPLRFERGLQPRQAPALRARALAPVGRGPLRGGGAPRELRQGRGGAVGRGRAAGELRVLSVRNHGGLVPVR